MTQSNLNLTLLQIEMFAKSNLYVYIRI